MSLRNTVIATILGGLLTTAGYASNQNKEADPFAFESRPAINAYQAYLEHVRRAEESYRNAVSQARERAIRDLERAQTAATRAGDLDEAIRIRDAIAALSAEEVQIPDTTPGVLLTAPAAAAIVRDQLDAFVVSDDTTIQSPSGTQRLILHGTEGRNFVLMGEIRFSGSLTGAHPVGGVEFFLRETSGTVRYEFSPRGLRSKRRLLAGEPTSNILMPVHWERVEADRWYPFVIEVHWQGIHMRLGDEVGVVEGPLSVDGTNSIYLGRGAVRNVRILFLD